jgi:hypothetical protein
MYPPFQWRVRTRRRYAYGVLGLAAIMAICWLVSFEPWPVALRTVVLIQVAFIVLDAVRYGLRSRGRSSANERPAGR